MEGDKVISYTTHVATINRAAGKLYVHGWWSVTTSKHINHIANELGLIKEDQDLQEESKPSNDLNTIAMVAKLGDVFGQNQKEKNDWKTRMLKAGLGGRGLIMPNDWDKLDENTKQARLDGAIEQLK